MSTLNFAEETDALTNRVDRLVDSVERLDRATGSIVRDESRQILDEYLKTIDEFNEFVSETKQTDKRIIIEQFHRRFDRLNKDLILGLTVQQVFDRFYRENPTILFEIPLSQLEIQEKVSIEGKFYNFHRATWLTQRDQVFIKKFSWNNQDERRIAERDFLDESSILSKIRYEKILNIFAICRGENFFGLVAEFMSLGSLYDVLYDRTLSNERISFSWTERRSLILQMTKAVHFIHNFSPPIIHRQINSKHFLLKFSGEFSVKLHDFTLTSTFGSWTAPELLDNPHQHTRETDIYSLGIVFYELVTGQRPWVHFSEDFSFIEAQIREGKRPQVTSNVPLDIRSWIERSLRHNAFQRPTAAQLLQEQCLFENTDESNQKSHNSSIYRLEKRRPLHQP